MKYLIIILTTVLLLILLYHLPLQAQIVFNAGLISFLLACIYDNYTS